MAQDQIKEQWYARVSQHGRRDLLLVRSDGPRTFRVMTRSVFIIWKTIMSGNLALARAESLNGNTVGAENYYQHTEHYYREMSSASEGK
jgi:hypothetical protein